jgi:PAS domain S-box-containing protein
MALQPDDLAQLRLSAIVSSSEDAIISKDLSGTITSWNRAAERIFGYTEAEAVGQSIRLIVPPELYADEDEVLRRIRGGEVVEHYETDRIRKDGARVRVSLTVSPIRTTAGKVIGASKIARDITERIRLQRDARWLTAIINSSDDAIVGKDLNGVVQSWNPAAERLFGYTAAEIVGRSIRLIIPPERQSEEDHVLATIRRGDTVDHLETVRLRKDGSRVTILLTVSPIRANDGTIVGASKIARDIERTQRAQRDARRLAAIVDSSDDAIVSKDLDGIVTSWNRAAEKMFGYTPNEMIGQSIRKLLPEERQSEEDVVLARIRRGERVEHYETIRQRKNGERFPVSLTVSPILDAAGRVMGASKIARDITERVRTDEERRRLLAIAQDATRLRDEFLATLSHELRTPLNAILGYARMMRSGLLTGDKLTRAVDTVARNANSLAQIVEDVLDVSSIISGKLRLSIQTVDVSAIVREALETVRPAVEAKGLRVTTTIDSNVPPVKGDPARLQQILWNLLSNAVKFTPRGGRIAVDVHCNELFVNVSVADTGIGIPAEFLPYVFDRFRQADSGISRAHGGLGLGLAISRHLVELQGGRIAASSDGPNTGATFSVEFPIESAPSTEDGADEQRPTAADRPPDLLVPRLDDMVVLAVDDDPDALSLVEEILGATGARVIAVRSAQAALDALEHQIPDVLVADLGMPGMTGFDLIEKVRKSDRRQLRDLPAVALTAYARSEDRAKALLAGFHAHLPKPVDPETLMATVASLAGRTPVSD